MDIRQEQRQPEGRARGTAVAVTLVAAFWVLAACSAGVTGSHSSPQPHTSSTTGTTGTSETSDTSGTNDTSGTSASPCSSPTWLLTRSALSKLMAHPAVRAKLQGSLVYEILQPGQQPLAGVTAKPVVTFASATALEDAVTGGRLPAGTYGVLYDPEAWSFTPVAEKRDPVQAATRAAAVAHRHGLRLIVAPALNLTTVLAPGRRQPRWRAFLDLNLVARLAGVADVVEIQAQSLERDTATYAAFVQAATSQASAANPQVIMLAGLSTNPPGAPVDSHQLTAAIRATRSMVDGYWLNIPGRGPRCPTCNAPRPDIAIQTLHSFHDPSRAHLGPKPPGDSTTSNDR
jgi:hypothetical protein